MSMNRYEKQLLNHLQAEGMSSDNTPLKNVREALGNVRYVKGNPFTKTQITLEIRTIIEQVGVGIILPAALPANLKTKVSAYLFSLTDFYSGFQRMRNIIPSGFGWFSFPTGLGTTGIVGFNANLPPVGYNYEIGDLIMQFTDGGLPPLYRMTVIVHCPNVAYGTFLNSFVSDLITVSTIRYIVPVGFVDTHQVVEQFINPLTFGYQTLFGKTFTDDIDPRNFITSTDFQQQICDIPVNLPIDKASMLGFNIDYFCQDMQMILFVEKVEPLTHK